MCTVFANQLTTQRVCNNFAIIVVVISIIISRQATIWEFHAVSEWRWSGDYRIIVMNMNFIDIDCWIKNIDLQICIELFWSALTYAKNPMFVTFFN